MNKSDYFVPNANHQFSFRVDDKTATNLRCLSDHFKIKQIGIFSRLCVELVLHLILYCHLDKDVLINPSLYEFDIKLKGQNEYEWR